MNDGTALNGQDGVRTGHGKVQVKQRSANMVHGTGQAAVGECTGA